MTTESNLNSNNKDISAENSFSGWLTFRDSVYMWTCVLSGILYWKRKQSIEGADLLGMFGKQIYNIGN